MCSKAMPNCSCCPPKCCSPAISNCIFDLESAIFDTRYIYRKAIFELAHSYYADIPKHLLMQTRPMTTAEMAELVCRKCDLPVSWETFRYQLNERTSEMIANPPMMSGAWHLVKHLRNCCVELGLVTSCTESNYCAKIRGMEAFFENFSTVVCSDDWELRAPKPEPDVYLIAMSRLGDAGPKNTLVFDGTLKGVQAARDARLPVVMLAEPSLPCCWSELASLRLEYLDDFNPEDFQLPKYPADDHRWRGQHEDFDSPKSPADDQPRRRRHEDFDSHKSREGDHPRRRRHQDNSHRHRRQSTRHARRSTWYPIPSSRHAARHTVFYGGRLTRDDEKQDNIKPRRVFEYEEYPSILNLREI